jgi:hypothetical protein
MRCPDSLALFNNNAPLVNANWKSESKSRFSPLEFPREPVGQTAGIPCLRSVKAPPQFAYPINYGITLEANVSL